MCNLPLGPLMVDVQGTSLTDHERDFLRAPSIGAVILFSRNFESKTQVKNLILEIKSLRSPSLLVAVDQEGGRVQRFRDGFFPLPPVQKFGIRYDVSPEEALSLAKSAGRIMASELADVGIDFSFAPVLDQANDDSAVIGDRSFHYSATVVTELANAFIDGMNSTGMSATGKHFPGHGGVTGDSHLMKPIDNRTIEELQNSDLIPYQALASKLGGVMTAHVLFPQINDSIPTFSPYWIKQILRQRIGFDGLIFSDDLSMKGAHDAGTPLQRTGLALEAGCDMALICNDPINAESVAKALSHISTKPARLEAMRLKPNLLANEDEIGQMQDRLMSIS
ncbi:MAG: beta-N-acetylhexosaminidase [Gammaproteobacteria bacterium]|nr:beta-N-acetylhexosaminidase [Gammaproteobacteria bacterium]